MINAKNVILKRECMVGLVVVVIFVIIGSLSRFWWAKANMIDLLWLVTPLGLIGIGQTLVVMSGNFDCSVSSLFGLSAVVGAVLSYHTGISEVVIVLVALGLGAFVGLLNGLVVVKVGVPSFLATFGSLCILRALVWLVGYGLNVWALPGPFRRVTGLMDLARGDVIWGIAPSFFIFVALAVAVYLLLHKTNIGLRLRAAGGNELAASDAGVSIVKIKTLSFVISGAFASFAGLLYAVGVKSIWPIMGAGQEIMSIAAVIIGGAGLTGGSGSVLGTLLGCLMFVSIEKGMAQLGLTAWQYHFTRAFAVIAALTLGVMKFGGTGLARPRGKKEAAVEGHEHT